MWPLSLVWRSGRDRQIEQISKSLDRQAEQASHQRQAAQSENMRAAVDVTEAIGRRFRESDPLREVLRGVIDQQQDHSH